MSQPNSKQWSSATPGYIIFLVDQSGSMSENYGEGKNKSEFTALVINRTINELINTNMDGEKVKDRLFISMIGYGGSGSLAVDDIRSDYLSSFADSPIRMESLKKKVSDGAGGLIEIDEQMPIFIEPVANGLTPMAEALSFAKELINGWLTKKPENPAPVIINISDGLPYTGGSSVDTSKSISVSKEIMSINSIDGNPLLFNCHLGDGGAKVCEFAESESEISDDQAKFLFNISSKVPESYKQAAVKQDLKVGTESRGFVSNADPDLFIKFINFGSSGGGTDKIA
ncbi:vWA domain-containing protein [Maribacter dokdonensis]|uniref:vWA domain-containing protein n=1 Tax=Maribacter dokdonensis TaxID=320912 RepID=UPI00071997F3|nr:vWA domain-containing protein [Maribacter dokdonensis]KSA13481.1 hypothetical protein I600_71 [Maribacter dokdonensis DSW-8]